MAGTPPSLASAALISLESHLLDRVDAAVLAVDLEGWILFANQGAEELYGWRKEELVGRLASEFSGVAIDPDTAGEIMAALSHGMSWEGSFDVAREDGKPLSVHAINSPLYDATGVLCGVVSVSTDASRERTEQFLARCADVLGASLDFDRNLLALAKLLVPQLADLCIIDVAVDGAIRRTAAVAGNPDQQALMDELSRSYPPDPDGLHPAAEALRSGTSAFVAEITEDVRRSLAQDERHYKLVHELGITSYMCVPLTARGRTLGAVSVASCNGDRRFGAEDIELLTEIARRAALALDNARLYDDQDRARVEAESAAERLEQLQTLSTALGRAVTVDEVTRVIGAIHMPQLGSENRGLWLVNEQTETLELVNGFDLSGMSDRYGSISLDSHLPAAEVVRQRAP